MVLFHCEKSYYVIGKVLDRIISTGYSLPTHLINLSGMKWKDRSLNQVSHNGFVLNVGFQHYKITDPFCKKKGGPIL